MHKVINSSNILGAISFLSMIAVPGAIESGMYMTAIVLTAIFGLCAYLSIKEDGKKR